MTDVAGAVTGVVEDLFGGSDVADESPNGPTDAAADTPQDAAIELPTVPDLPDELAEFLDEPDFEAEAEVHDSDEWTDPDDLARENAKLRKKLEFAETKRAESEKNKWKTEAEKYFPYADTTSPEYSSLKSRRSFLTHARAEHSKIKSRLAPILQDVEAAKEAGRRQAYEEAKKAQAEGWGKPNVSGGPSAPIEAAQKADDLDAARNSRNLSKVVKALINSQEI